MQSLKTTSILVRYAVRENLQPIYDADPGIGAGNVVIGERIDRVGLKFKQRVAAHQVGDVRQESAWLWLEGVVM